MQNKITFFKEKIKNRIEELKPFMSDIKYRLYISMIEDCDSLEEIREMAELDLQFNMIKYVRDLDSKLKLSDTNIEELEAVTNRNNRAVKLTVIAPKKVKTNKDIANDFDLSTLGEDIEDEELLACAANILYMRLQNTPPEELYSSSEEDCSIDEDDIDNIDLEAELEDELDEEEDDSEDEFEGFELDIDEDEMDMASSALDFQTEDESLMEQIESDIEDDDDEIIDFGIDEAYNDEEEQDIDSMDLDSMFEDSDEDDFEEEQDIDSIDLDSMFEDSEDEEEPEEEQDIDSMDLDSMFEDSEEEEESDEYDIDSIGDDIFETEESDEDDFVEEQDIDSMDLDSMFEDGDDFEESDEDEYSFENSIENSDLDSLFGEDDFIEEEEELEEEISNGIDIDSIDTDSLFGEEEDEPEFDIDDGQFEFEEPEEDNFESFFDRNTARANNQPATQTREMTSTKVFMNGTKRGNQTQQMFNMLGSIFSGTGKIAKKAVSGTKNLATKSVNKINNSDLFRL